MPPAKKPEEIIKILEEQNRALRQEGERLLIENKKLKELSIKTVSKIKAAYYDLEMATSKRFNNAKK